MEILTPTPARKVPKSGQHSETKATSLFFTLDAQCVSPQISKWFWGLKGKVLKYFSTGGLIPRLGTSTSIPWVHSTAQGKKERKEMGSLRICILRGKRSKN